MNDSTKIKKFAFFDVDETLVAEKTMFTILEAIGKEIPTLDTKGLVKELEIMRSKGYTRGEVNLKFYQGLSGLKRSLVITIAKNYIAKRIKEDNEKPFFIKKAFICSKN